jgi:hypothetical protein
MLYVIYKPKIAGLSGAQQVWHIGEDLVLAGPIQDVEEVQADGDELAEVYEQDLAPLTLGKPVVRWFGDQAKFVVGNLTV